MTAVLLSFLLIAPPDPEELLRRVAARYSAMDEFLLEVRETMLAFGTIGAEPIRKTLAIAPGNRFSLEIRSTERHRIVSDGRLVYSYRVGSKEYFEEEFGGAGHRRVDEEIHALFERYSMLDRVAPSARFLRTARVKLDSGPVECAVIEVALQSSESPRWPEILWIDPDRALILRSDFSPNGRVREYREYLLPPGIEKPGAALFQFEPLKGMRKK